MANCDFFMQDLAQASDLISGPSRGPVIVWLDCSIRGNTTSGLTRPTSGSLFFEPRRVLTVGHIAAVVPDRLNGTLKTDPPFDELGVTISGPKFVPEEGLSIDIEVRLFGGEKVSPPRHIVLSPVTCHPSTDQPGTGELQADGFALDGGRLGSYFLNISPLQHIDLGVLKHLHKDII